MLYPLEEKIGPPELLVGRANEFYNFNQWLQRIPRRLSQSRVILARRKSGKTSFIQRIFNQLWNENGAVVPFYLDIEDHDISQFEFAVKYYEAFASQYISFLEREPIFIRKPLSLEKIYEYGVNKKLDSFADETGYVIKYRDEKRVDPLWDRASHAPHRLASGTDRRFLVILDEFQNIANHIYRSEAMTGSPMKSMPGTFHSLSESKVAPMLVTGSYPGVLQKIMDEHLEAGRLDITHFEPYLAPSEGLLAVYKYAEVYDEPITTYAAQEINELCMSDPFFISRVILSNYAHKDLTTTQGVINTIEYEVKSRKSMMSTTWAQYIRKTFERINGTTTKGMMLFLNKYDDRYWTPKDLKHALELDLDEDEIFKRLEILADSDVIAQGVADIDFRGLRDGTLNLILRHRFEKEIEGTQPNFQQEFQDRLVAAHKETSRWRGLANELAGLHAERLFVVELQSRKHLRLSRYFSGVADDTELNIIDVQERLTFRRKDNKEEEIDILATADDGRVVMIEVRKRQKKTNIKTVKDLRDNALAYAEQHDVTVLPAFLSLGGFTKDAETFCLANGIGIAETLEFYLPSD
ncbi:MAG: hypothetical protein AAF639_32280 [Chloroflexota bacterium]